jgi:error-prone DNA polymerase
MIAAEREMATIAEDQEPEVALRQMTDGHNVVEDYSHTGLTLRQHPVAFLRRDLSARNIITCAEAMNARDGRCVYTAGLVLVRQKPGSAEGVMFITIEDRNGSGQHRRLAHLVRKTPARGAGILDDGNQWPDPAGMGGCASRRAAAVRLSADLIGLADRDIQFRLPTGRGDEFAHGGGPDSRDRPKPVVPRDLFTPDRHIDTLKVKARNFH